MLADAIRTRTILILEDDATLAQVFSRALRSSACRVETVGTVAEALARIRNGRHDVMISDLRLPDGNGISAVAAFRGRNPAGGVVVISGALTFEEDLAGVPIGSISGCLVKPFSLGELRRAVDAALSERARAS